MPDQQVHLHYHAPVEQQEQLRFDPTGRLRVTTLPTFVEFLICLWAIVSILFGLYSAMWLAVRHEEINILLALVGGFVGGFLIAYSPVIALVALIGSRTRA